MTVEQLAAALLELPKEYQTLPVVFDEYFNGELEVSEVVVECNGTLPQRVRVQGRY